MQKISILVFFIIIFFISCSRNNETKSLSIIENNKKNNLSKSFINNHDYLLNIKEVKDDFLFKNKLEIFDTLLLQNIINNFEGKYLKGEVLNKLFQGNTCVFKENEEYSYILVSLQDTTMYYSLTLFYQRWGWLSSVYLRTYSKDGVFIDEIELLAKGSDAEIKYLAWGKFINDSTYKKTTIETVINEEMGLAEIDTILTQYIILNNGKIEKKERTL